MPTYARLPVAFTKGNGAWLWDEENNKYLDAISGIAVCGLGHAHPKIANVIKQQAENLLHTSNIYRIPAQEQLGAHLCEITNMQHAFFCNSGAEANEAAIKLARIFGNNKQIETPTVIVFENSFHGRTMATLTATGNRKAHAGFEPLVAGFARSPYGDIETVKRICTDNPNVCAILVEPIQGEGGINIPPHNFLEELRAICDEQDLLLMLDEVQTGNGRTGKWFAFQHHNVLPDVLTTAKGLGNGMPIGACLTQGRAAELFSPGMHGSTFGGNPLACSVALEVLNIIEQDGLLEHADKMGQHLVTLLKEKLAQHSIVKDIRGHGLMLGIELNQPCKEIVTMALENNLLVNVTAASVIRLLPPLIINDEEANKIVSTLYECITEFSKTHIEDQQ